MRHQNKSWSQRQPWRHSVHKYTRNTKPAGWMWLRNLLLPWMFWTLAAPVCLYLSKISPHILVTVIFSFIKLITHECALTSNHHITIYTVCIVWEWEHYTKGLVFTFLCFWNLLSFKAEEMLVWTLLSLHSTRWLHFWVLLCENLKYDDSHLCSYVPQTRFTFTCRFFPLMQAELSLLWFQLFLAQRKTLLSFVRGSSSLSYGIFLKWNEF